MFHLVVLVLEVGTPKAPVFHLDLLQRLPPLLHHLPVPPQYPMLKQKVGGQHQKKGKTDLMFGDISHTWRWVE
ncbi:unnamed protein product [Linum trigynum]|uniref:Secreted protein n=1 Tax=Linum trigynum TaxID=586398 RepID=A0AAV2G4N3_9ROSI